MLAEKALQKIIVELPPGARVLDVGCGPASFMRFSGAYRSDLSHFGCDIVEPADIPEDYAFKIADLREPPLPYDDDSFDLIMISHVIEHLLNPIEVLGECLRVLRPSGRLYIEAPSDHSLLFSWPFSKSWNLIFSYYDDPTHIGRPWTPQAFHRIAVFFDVQLERSNYDSSLISILTLPFALLFGVIRKDPDMIVRSWWRGTGWACYAVMRKPETASGAMTFNYFSFRGKPIGYAPGAQVQSAKKA